METFKKRQKEMQRLERRREKAARRLRRKQNPEGTAGNGSPDDAQKAPSDSQPGIESTTNQPAT
jgi:hypothetical protein